MKQWNGESGGGRKCAQAVWGEQNRGGVGGRWVETRGVYTEDAYSKYVRVRVYVCSPQTKSGACSRKPHEKKEVRK